MATSKSENDNLVEEASDCKGKSQIGCLYFTCQICQIKFEEPLDFSKHMTDVHETQCNICMEKLPTENAYLRHLQMIHKADGVKWIFDPKTRNIMCIPVRTVTRICYVKMRAGKKKQVL